MGNYDELWEFVGKEIGTSNKAKIKVEFISSSDITSLIKKRNELTLEINARLNKVSKEELLEYLRINMPYQHQNIVSPKEVNGICFTLPFLKTQGILDEIIKILPIKNPLDYDVLIYINEGNLEKRRQEWSRRARYQFTIEDIRVFLVIHEMIHGHKRLAGISSTETEMTPFDFEASKIFWKWKTRK